jgi:predicted HTH domain antitoxin
MGEPIGIRLPDDVLKKIEKLGRVRLVDRSTIIRELVIKGYQEVMRQMAFDDYVKGSITFSEAAHRAGMTLWEMERYLIGKGFKSSYSVDDLEKELRSLR